jgi:hypothetical protein
MYESNIPSSIGYGRKVLTKSGVGISRKCCFPHGKTSEKVMVVYFGTLTCPNLCSPNEDLGRPNKPVSVCFRSTFQGCEYPIWATKRWKVLRKRILKGLFGLPKSSFGRGKIIAFFVIDGSDYVFMRYVSYPTAWQCDVFARLVKGACARAVLKRSVRASRVKGACARAVLKERALVDIVLW